METKKKLFTRRGLSLMFLILWLMVISPTVACPLASTAGSGCKECIVDQMKHGCPSCAPILRCMARCLWGGGSRSKCVKKCDCDGAMLRLSDCKKCMARCKCSCVAYRY
ncbi:uncharacterized protein LOC110629573 [Manihot esculenta]|uniref:TNFR-Cys domain-containing protein n=1 Tax=Manihot esculenta TaxID=3983 RepID=A0A2C9URU5_MANES|nr:uncharacterized protein LOC110629573 [Manihot esculenta]OAY33565.1 hypothetical protein MANES_13G107300v8 [Manihot esculenta]